MKTSCCFGKLFRSQLISISKHDNITINNKKQQHNQSLCQAEITVATGADDKSNKVAPVTSQNSNNTQLQQEFKLNCKPGEQRHFNYESATKVWGSSNQQVFLRATLRLSCMEPQSNITIKYLAEILSVSGDFGDVITYNGNNRKETGKRSRSTGVNNPLRVEPVLEEVGEAISEAADRFKRSVSGWFTKTWGSVKDFFVNIFTTSEKSSVSREDVFRESGIDISSQCRGGKGKGSPSGLPIDDSVFDDLEPKYFIGASSVGGGGSGGSSDSTFRASSTSYDFDEQTDGDEATISFFDDPKPQPKRSKRATKNDNDISTPSNNKQQQQQRALGSQNELDHERLLRLPFVFVQSLTGRVIEVRFSGEESDLSVKNFKRHLCDLFATNLESNRSQTNEVSPIGEHTTKYIVDPTLNSSYIKQSLLKSASFAGADPTKFLVKALGVTQQQQQQHVGNSESPDWGKFNNNVESRDPTAAANGSLGDVGNQQSLSVLRSINSTSSLQLNSRTITPDIDQIHVRVKQVQQINDGRMVGSAGQLAMSLVQSNGDDKQSNKFALRMGRSAASTASVGASKSQDKQSASSSSSPEQLEDIADLLKVSTSFTVQLVPLSKLGNFNTDLATTGEANGRTTGDGPQSNGRMKRASNPTSSSSPSKVSVGDSLRQPLSKEQAIVKKGDATASKEKDSVDLYNDRDSNNLSPTHQKLTSATGDSSVELSHHHQLADNKSESTINGNSNRIADGLPRVHSSKRSTNKDREPLVLRPSDDQQLQRALMEWRQLELRLQMVPSNLLPESSGQDGQLQRLEILRDQIRMRLNEEFMRNRLRRSRGGDSNNNNDNDDVASAAIVDPASQRETSAKKPPPEGAAAAAKQTQATKQSNDLGLGLTQLILDNGVTAKRKGSVYGTIEEVLDLEMALGEETREGSVSRLMRDTIRIDSLKTHCKSAIATLDEIRAKPQKAQRSSGSGSGGKVEIRSPFGMLEDEKNDDDDEATMSTVSNEQLARIIADFQTKNRRKLEQCKQVVQLLLRVSDKKAADLVLELMDDCNNRMLSGAKYEELGHGPTSRYYRNLRQQFTELMGNINRPSEKLLDKLLARLHYSKLLGDSDSGSSSKRVNSRPPVSDPQQEFTYISPKQQRSGPQNNNDAASYNKSLLREEDNFNNDEGAGSLVMTITTLAAKPSIGRAKRIEVVERLLQTLKGSSCSLFHGPDLDILESMGNFQEPLDEMVGKIVHLARRCRHQDQYLVACVHALQGQLRHPATTKFLSDLLRAQNGSCTVKSEIVLTLIGAILIDELNSIQQQPSHLSNNQIPTAAGAAATSGAASGQWPSVGLNQVDEILLELVADSNSEHAQQGNNNQPRTNNKRSTANAQDRRCLKQLVAYYMSKKRHQQLNESNDITRPHMVPPSSDTNQNSKANRGSRASQKQNHPQTTRRTKRAVVNDDSFWDEAQCKRWALPDPNALASDSGNSMVNASDGGSLHTDLVDEIDDNSILLALAQNKPIVDANSGRRFTGRRNQKLIERESDLPSSSSSGIINNNSSLSQISNTLTSGSQNNTIPIIRRRHKCTASKSFGPKNAEATLKAEIVNDLVGARDENKFLARFRLATNFLGNRIDIGRMYLWHQKHTTRAHVNILGKSLWDTSHGCEDKAPRHLLYMPLFDFNLWLVKVSVGLRLHSEMGFFSNCDSSKGMVGANSGQLLNFSPPKQTKFQRSLKDGTTTTTNNNYNDDANSGRQLELFPTMTVRASGEASAKFVVARAGMSLASQYGYQGNIRVSQQPESCMSISSAHQPMNITFSSWFQLWDSDCHYWGSRNKAEPQATKWKLQAHKPSVWLEDECLIEPKSLSSSSLFTTNGSGKPLPASTITRSLQTISP